MKKEPTPNGTVIIYIRVACRDHSRHTQSTPLHIHTVHTVHVKFSPYEKKGAGRKRF